MGPPVDPRTPEQPALRCLRRRVHFFPFKHAVAHKLQILIEPPNSQQRGCPSGRHRPRRGDRHQLRRRRQRIRPYTPSTAAGLGAQSRTRAPTAIHPRSGSGGALAENSHGRRASAASDPARHTRHMAGAHQPDPRPIFHTTVDTVGLPGRPLRLGTLGGSAVLAHSAGRSGRCDATPPRLARRPTRAPRSHIQPTTPTRADRTPRGT